MTPTDRRHARRMHRRARVAMEYARNKRPGALQCLRLRVHDLRRVGKTDDEIAAGVARDVDALVPAGVFGPVGAVVEALDGPVVYLIARLILATVRR